MGGGAPAAGGVKVPADGEEDLGVISVPPSAFRSAHHSLGQPVASKLFDCQRVLIKDQLVK